MPDVIKILSIDGGGMRGVIPAVLLAELEKRTGKRVAELFHLIAGTSTGGILALGLAKPGADKQKSQFAARELLGIYETDGPVIFHRSALYAVRSVDGVLDQKYPSDGIDKTLVKYFGEARLSEALTEVLITSYETEKRDPFFFKRHKAKLDPNMDFPMRLAARATSAAPSYFEPVKVQMPNASYSFVDGGVVANNPAMCAYVEARKIFPTAKHFILVSLGTGDMVKPILYDKAKDWGLAEWVQPLFNILLDGDAVDYQLRQLMPIIRDEPRHYYRFQTRPDPNIEPIDDTSPDYINLLKSLTEELIRANTNNIDNLCGQLLAE
ncbi:MAG: patatin-like phospholipase family protein [Chloroflexi bacterium]|nr:patatin-like phospholipase family protein [Chloroflexota bacterium]